MSALAKLTEDYCSSSSEDEEEENGKRKSTENQSPIDDSKRLKTDLEISTKINSNNQLLPVPSEVLSMFESDDDVLNEEDSSNHEGRIRSFAHERGNWATHVFISYVPETFFIDLVDRLLSRCTDMKANKEFHISLSKTVVLKYHWINPFTSSLKKKFETFKKSVVIFDALAAYVNEEKSRTFLGFKITIDDFLKQLTEKVNETLGEFHLPTFYQESSFHLTIGWCLGNQKEQLLSLLPKLEDELLSFCEDNSEKWPFIKVEEIVCKTGNKLFCFPLL
ncbi:poly(U)-specific 3'-to-5' RNA exonuclease [Chamberlinius hualienensis]